MSVDPAQFNELSTSVAYGKQIREKMLAECRAWMEYADNPRHSQGGLVNRIMKAIDRVVLRGNPSEVRGLLNDDLLRLIQLANLSLCSLKVERDEMKLMFLTRELALIEESDKRMSEGVASVFNPEHQGDVERGASTADVAAPTPDATEGTPHDEG